MVPTGQTNHMVHGLADGTLTVDKPEEDTFVTGELSDAWIDDADVLRQRVSTHALQRL